jgi:selenide,water dikinase
LLLTKPIGTGILATAAKRGLASPEMTEGAVRAMRTLNRDAALAMEEFPVHACTDVTGFGLLGHLKEMARASGVDVEIVASDVPLLEGAREMAQAGAVPGGTRANQDYVADVVDWPETLGEVDRWLLCDAQTSGGLLIALAPDDADRLLEDLRRRGVARAVAVGRVTGEGTGRIRVRS